MGDWLYRIHLVISGGDNAVFLGAVVHTVPMVDKRRAPWLDWEPGTRVTLRYRGPDGLYDAVGPVVETGPEGVTIDTRGGRRFVHASTMVVGRVVGPVVSRARPRRGL